MAPLNSTDMTPQNSDIAPTGRQSDGEMISPNAQATPTHHSFLGTFPPEIRNEIYKLLLCNPLLADASVDMDETFDEEGNLDEIPIVPPVQYGLCPAVLRTCKQIYEEASVVLYEHNTFYFVCRGPWEWHDYHGILGMAPLCPLYKRNYDSRVGHGTGLLKNIPAVRRVKNWKVFLNASDVEGKLV